VAPFLLNSPPCPLPPFLRWPWPCSRHRPLPDLSWAWIRRPCRTTAAVVAVDDRRDPVGRPGTFKACPVPKVNDNHFRGRPGHRPSSNVYVSQKRLAAPKHHSRPRPRASGAGGARGTPQSFREVQGARAGAGHVTHRSCYKGHEGLQPLDLNGLLVLGHRTRNGACSRPRRPFGAGGQKADRCYSCHLGHGRRNGSYFGGVARRQTVPRAPGRRPPPRVRSGPPPRPRHGSTPRQPLCGDVPLQTAPRTASCALRNCGICPGGRAGR